MYKTKQNKYTELVLWDELESLPVDEAFSVALPIYDDVDIID
jgi:hypothetical protein